MALTRPIRLRVDDPSGVAPARRAAERLAADLGFDEEARGKVAIVVTELTTNLLRHAGNGEVIVRAAGAAHSVDVVAWDTGPGIPNLGRARGDGFSTAGGSGTGLGAVERLSADGRPAGRRRAGSRHRRASAATPGPTRTWTGWRSRWMASGVRRRVGAGPRRRLVTILLADGLGHGDDAAAAANAAVREMRAGIAPEALLQRIHGALRPTRGAAAAVARLDLRDGALRVRRDREHRGDDRRRRTHAGRWPRCRHLGHRSPSSGAFEHELAPGALLVMHSDGCERGWDLGALPGRRNGAIRSSSPRC